MWIQKNRLQLICVDSLVGNKRGNYLSESHLRELKWKRERKGSACKDELIGKSIKSGDELLIG